jgi:hypothetical protein
MTLLAPQAWLAEHPHLTPTGLYDVLEKLRAPCLAAKVAAVLGALLRMGFVRSSKGGRSCALRRAA